MISTTPNLPPETIELFEQGNIGLFEINDEGTVLYCRAFAEKFFYEKSAASVGRNFFDDVAPFENMEELRRHFNKFIKSHSSTTNFSFNCRIKSRSIPAKVMLVRIVERSNTERAEFTIVDIRKI
ncbi:MAG: hypothetical protein ACR2LT_09425 [Pyrinomonadaceae bacterium]